MLRRNFTKLIAGVCLATSLMGGHAFAADKMRIALVVKALGIGFFEAAAKGAEEAAAELGDVEIIYTGPTDTTAEGQIEVINSLIAQGVDAIAVSANDPDALVPALKKAMQRGILFAGSPDTVFEQIKTFYEEVGGFGHLVTMGRAGFMTHAETNRSIELLANEVAPRIAAFHAQHLVNNP